MADITITAANVVPYSNAVKKQVTAGATITAGMPVYKDTSTGKYVAADADSATALARSPVGIALHAASDGQPLTIQTGGDINMGATLTVGTIYCLSDVAGAVRPSADNSTGDYVTILGVAIAANKLRLGILASGVAIP